MNLNVWKLGVLSSQRGWFKLWALLGVASGPSNNSARWTCPETANNKNERKAAEKRINATN